MFELTVHDGFAAAHNLRGYKGQCENLHGHNWRVTVVVGADELDELGMVMDFRDIKKALSEVLERLDHGYLNEVEPFDEINPTTEYLSRYIADELESNLPSRVSVRRVSCWESERCGATYIAEP
jgi:6-pyruvoyltetrahydropterin/6-carboxytetrahydropterin synthase